MPGGFFGNMSDLATKKIFGPNARFFPKSWEEPTPPFAARPGNLSPGGGSNYGYEGVFSPEGIGDQFSTFPKPTAAQEAQDADVAGMLGDESLRKPERNLPDLGDESLSRRLPDLGDDSISAPTPFTARPGNLSPDQPSNYSKEGITNMIDLKRLGVDLAAGKVKNAPGLADQIVGSPKPKPKPKASSGFNFTPGPSGFSSEMGSKLTDINEELPQDLPAAKNIEGMSGDTPGGGGVEVADQEGGDKQPRDWQSIMGMVGIGLTDIGNAFGNPRARQGGAFYDLMKEKLQTQQMNQLKQRQNMWDDAYSTSQSLPQEVLTDPRFAGLAQAKAALDKDMMDGKIDNEKNVSLFLTEQARVKKDLEELGLQNKANQQLDVENRLATGRAEQEAEQTQKAQEIASNPTAYPPAEVEQARLILASRKQIFEEDGQQLHMTPTEYAQWKRQNELADEDRRIRELGITESSNARVEAARLAAEARRDSRGDRQSDFRARFVQDSYEKAIARRMPPREAMEDMDEATRNRVVSEAAGGAVDELAPRLMAAAQQAGVKVEEIPGPPRQMRVGEQLFDDPREGMYYLMTMLGGGGQ